jgi:hypothetical protein
MQTLIVAAEKASSRVDRVEEAQAKAADTPSPVAAELPTAPTQGSLRHTWVGKCAPCSRNNLLLSPFRQYQSAETIEADHVPSMRFSIGMKKRYIVFTIHVSYIHSVGPFV